MDASLIANRAWWGSREKEEQGENLGPCAVWGVDVKVRNDRPRGLPEYLQ